ncbi:MAG: hypothetical protein Q9182_002609 [Xanthomendoza sp. 2 TL-2023]
MPLQNSKAAVQPHVQGSKPVRLDSLRNPQPRNFPFHSPAAKKKPSDRISLCTAKGCESTDLGEDNGYLVCQSCGTILQETNIVSDNTFIETSGGDSMRAGKTVSNDASRARVYDPVGARIAGGMSSRELSEDKGRRAIQEVARHPLNIVHDLQNTAMQVYKLALANNFVQGRETKNVAAVCLYIACRKSKENNKWMLIDFADSCDVCPATASEEILSADLLLTGFQINVFKLGMTFKALLAVLHLSAGDFGDLMPVHEESLILRFAEQMGFGRMKQRIANEASRIVQRMKHDWISHGRRPAGICGAALLLAARMNNFRRTVREVVYIVKVAEVTVSKRLDEFKSTESSGLTVAQFRDPDLSPPPEADPPAFKSKEKAKAKAKEKKREKRLKKRNVTIEIESDDEEDDTVNESRQDQSDTPPSRQTRAKKLEAALEIEGGDLTGTGLQRAVSASPSLAGAQLRTPADTQAQGDHRHMPPPQSPIDPALVHVAKLRQLRTRKQSLQTSSEPGRLTGNRDRPPVKAKSSAEPPASDLEAELELEKEITDMMNDETNRNNAEIAHKDPNAPGLEAAKRMGPGLSTPSQTQTVPAPKSDDQKSLPAAAESRHLTSASPHERLADQRSQSRRSQSIHSPSRDSHASNSPSRSLRSSRSSSRSPSPPPKRRRSVRKIELITANSTTQSLLDRIPSTEIIPEEEFADDIDIANCLLDSQESTIKERLWVNANADYLRAFQAKLLKQQLAEQNGTARKVVKRKRRRTRMGDLSGVYDERGPPRDTSEAVERMMKKRAFSKKINYKLIEDTYGGSRSGSDPTSVTGGKSESPARSQERSRRQSAAPTTVLGPDGEIIVEGGNTPAAQLHEVDRPGDTRDEAIEIQDVESDADDYYDEDDEMAGVGQVVNDVIGGDDDDDEVDEEDGSERF